MKVTHCGITYSCATAVKCEVNKFIRLYDENGLEIAAFDNINDFSDYTIADGEFTAPGGCTLPIPLFVFNLGGKTYCALNVKDGEKVELLTAKGGTLTGDFDFQGDITIKSGRVLTENDFTVDGDDLILNWL